MKYNITMSLLVAVLMLAPTSAFASTDQKMSVMPYPGPVAQTSFETKTIQVTGVGKVTVVADTANITFTLQTFTKNYAEGSKSFNSALESLKLALAKHGVETSKISTNWLGFYPEYDYSTEFPTISRYNMTRSIAVELTSNIDKLDQIIDTIGSHSAKNVNIQDLNFNYGLKNITAARQARVMAVKDARAKAEEISSILGVTLAGVSKVEDYYYGNLFTGYSPNFDIELSMNFVYKFN